MDDEHKKNYISEDHVDSDENFEGVSESDSRSVSISFHDHNSDIESSVQDLFWSSYDNKTFSTPIQKKNLQKENNKYKKKTPGEIFRSKDSINKNLLKNINRDLKHDLVSHYSDYQESELSENTLASEFESLISQEIIKSEKFKLLKQLSKKSSV